MNEGEWYGSTKIIGDQSEITVINYIIIYLLPENIKLVLVFWLVVLPFAYKYPGK